ncbi:MAG: DUF4831 family protein [Bacteroidia bacterium]|nr:MAG: DUF4831 family protein [Bacteroidia bacterium]
MKILISTIAAIILSAACTTVKEVPGLVHTRVLPLGDTVKLHEGAVIYSLPLTAFDFTVIAEKRVLKAGPYYKYADQFLGLKDVITQDQVVWDIVEVRINPVTEVDPEQYYVIESDGLMQSNALALKSSGLVLDISSSIYNGRNYATDLNAGSNRLEFRDMGSDEYYNMEQDTTYRLVELDTAFIRIPYVLERRRQLTMEQQAENTARILLELREGRHMILTGEATVFPQDAAAIDEINRLEDEYISLFTGKSFNEIQTFKFFLIPDREMIGKPVIIFRFSPESGVVDAQDLSGRPIVVEMVSAGKVDNINMIKSDLSGGEKFDKLYYRIPEVVNVRVTDGRRTLGSRRQLVYQFGPVVTLPANYIIGK